MSQCDGEPRDVPESAAIQVAADSPETSSEVDIVLDERGKRCPLPIIALGKTSVSAPPGAVIVITADDPAAGPDIAAWCRLKGAELVTRRAAADGRGGEQFTIRLRS